MQSNTKQGLIQQQETNMVQLMDQSGIENAIDKLILKNNSLLPKNIVIDRIKNSAGFYVANRDDLMKLDKDGKMQLLYGVLKEAMLGCEAGTDYDIVPFKGKPVVCRKKEGWYKIIDMIKPAEIIKFTTNVIFKGDEYDWNPVTEELTHKKLVDSDKYQDIEGAYCYIKFQNGFEKTIFMSKKEIDAIKKVSPSATSSFSPWNTMVTKMVKTKCVKEMAKELFTLYSNKINSVLAQAVDADETSIQRVDTVGNIITDKTVYEEMDNEIIEQDEVVEAEKVEEKQQSEISREVNIDEI